MKNLVNNKIAEKICMGMLSLTFLFITLCSGNIIPTYAAPPNKVEVLNEDNLGLSSISDGDTRSYGATFRNADLEVGKSSGSISYKVEDGVGVLTLDNVDVANSNGLVRVDGTMSESEQLKINLVGDNKITTSPKLSSVMDAKPLSSTFYVMTTDVEFVGSGNLTINQGINLDDGTPTEKDTQGSAILCVSGSNLTFNGSGRIVINQKIDDSAISVELGAGGSHNLIVKGNTKIDVYQHNVAYINNTDESSDPIPDGAVAANAIRVEDNAELNVKLKNGGGYGIASTGGGIYVGPNAKISAQIEEGLGHNELSHPIWGVGGIIVDGGTLIAFDSDKDEGKYDGTGVQTYLKEKVQLKKGSKFEAFGKQHAVDPAKLVIDNDGEWEAFAGPTKEAAQRLDATTGTGIMDAMTANNYPYLKVQPKGTNTNDPSANKDKLPKTGDNTSVVPYVLLLAAGIFTVMVANKKIVLEK